MSAVWQPTTSNLWSQHKLTPTCSIAQHHRDCRACQGEASHSAFARKAPALTPFPLQAYAKKREKKEKAEAAKLEKQLHDLLAKGQTDADAAIEAGRKKWCVAAKKDLAARVDTDDCLSSQR